MSREMVGHFVACSLDSSKVGMQFLPRSPPIFDQCYFCDEWYMDKLRSHRFIESVLITEWNLIMD